MNIYSLNPPTALRGSLQEVILFVSGCAPSRGRPRFKLWLPDSRAHLHHKILKELSRTGKMTKWRDESLPFYNKVHDEKVYKNINAENMMSEIHTDTSHSIQFINPFSWNT